MLTHPEPTHPPSPSVPGPSKLLALRIGAALLPAEVTA